MMNFQKPRGIRRSWVTRTGRFRGGKLAPVKAEAVRPSEGGMLMQSITMELDPIAGRLITPVYGEMIAVFVPVQAMEALKNPSVDHAGLTDVVREKLLTGNPLFGLEPENEISKRCKVNPRSIGGVKQVSEAIRLAHNCAVNHLRQRKYTYAALLTASNTAITPALVSQTVLDRMNAVLDPDDRINGAVDLQLPTIDLPVAGIGLAGVQTGAASASVGIRETGATAPRTTTGWVHDNDGSTTNGEARIVVEQGPTAGYPKIVAKLNGVTAGNVSLVDFYNAETKDKLTRTMRQIVDDNPEYGEEMVLRWAHGLSVDTGKVPFVVHQETRQFGAQIIGATDSAGVETDKKRSDMMLMMEFSVPIPKTELGGIIVTFACLKPDEVIAAQPDPFLSDVWGLDNYVADELALDPVPVTIRELDSECLASQESTVAFYTGYNALKMNYISYGLSRQLNPTTVENKTALWQLALPMSVTPQSILYPADLSHYPFADQNAEVCTYTVTSSMRVATPIVQGPTPVETLAVIGSSDIFDEV